MKPLLTLLIVALAVLAKSGQDMTGIRLLEGFIWEREQQERCAAVIERGEWDVMRYDQSCFCSVCVGVHVNVHVYVLCVCVCQCTLVVSCMTYAGP